MRMMFMGGGLLIIWTSIVACLASTLTCLPDGIGEAQRKNLSADSLVYPMGLHTMQHPAGYLVAALAQILLEEKLGYFLTHSAAPRTVDAFYALAGCSTPTDVSDRGCGPRRTFLHVALEVWTNGYPDVWDALKKEWPDMLPERLGSLGYSGASSLYIRSSVQEAAYESEGLSLEYYREYNSSWNQAARYFASPMDMDTGRLMPCNVTSFQNSQTVYLQMTGDVEGVETRGNDTVPKCFDGHFWYPPSCRKNSSQCAVMLTGGNGWGIPDTMQKVAVHNMPVALAVAKTWDDYTKLPLELRLLFFWWEPDPTFLSISPKKISFPAYDRRAWLRGDQTSEGATIPVEKLVSRDLRKLAPDAVEFLSRLQIDIQDVEKMLLDQLNSDASWYDVACQWLRSNEAVWEPWLPDKTNCFAQFGLYNEKEERFVEDRSVASDLVCSACPSGRYSEELEDAKGRTHRCQQCSVRTFQSSGAAVSCDPCPLGSYQDELGSASCKRCLRGFYQNGTGQSSCLSCPDGTTTLGYSSVSQADCGCNENSINTALGTESFACEECGEGLNCPFGSTVESLRRGNSSLGSDFVASVVEGYFVGNKQPLHVYKCKPSTFCPGGQAGVCAGGLEGQPCAVCPAGQTWSGKQCQACEEAAVLVILGFVAFLLGVNASYYLVSWRVSSEASPSQAALMAAGISVNVFQFVGIFGLMAVRWPSELGQTTSSFQLFILDLDSLGVSCVAGSGFGRFLCAVLVFPAASMWLLYIHALRRVAPLRSWQLSRTMNTMGAMLQLGFSTMSAVALQPFMCYKHPNGLHSLAKYPNVMCGSSMEHGCFIILGTGLILFALAYMSCCAYASLNMPSWSLHNQVALLQSFRFLTAKFRLNAWFFGMLLPLRGLLLSLAVALATDVPQAQLSLATVVLLAYGALQMRCWPWQAEVINRLDMFLNSMLLLLLGTATVTSTSSQDHFARIFSLVLLICSSVGLLACFATILAAFLQGRYVRGDMGRMWLNLGSGHDPERVSHALTKCAEELLRLHSRDLKGNLSALSPYDLQDIASAITIISLEVTQSRGGVFCRRVALSALNQRLSLMGPEVPPLVPNSVTSPRASPEISSTEEESSSQPGATNPRPEAPEGQDEVLSNPHWEIRRIMVSEVF